MHIYKDYAFSWSCVTLLLDYELLKRDFEIKPISWNYRISSATQNFKKEREEFVVSNYMKQSFKQIEKEYFEILDEIYDTDGSVAAHLWQEKNGQDFIDYWRRKGTKTIDLNKYLKGLFISKESYDISKGKGFEAVINHPLFKGFVSSDLSRKNHENSMEKYKFRLTSY
jgi:hypothetical protein